MLELRYKKLGLRKLFFLILFCQTAFVGYSQKNVDTLFLGKNKYPLTKTKIFHNNNQDSPVLLPSEYKELFSGYDLKIKYNCVYDSIYETFELPSGDMVTLLKPHKSLYPYNNGEFFARNITDTIWLSSQEFQNLTPTINSNNKTILFCASKVDRVYNDTIITASHSYLTNGGILSIWQDYIRYDEKEILKLKESVFILRELYYKKGNSIFYLDRKFVFKINKI